MGGQTTKARRHWHLVPGMQSTYRAIGFGCTTACGVSWRVAVDVAAPQHTDVPIALCNFTRIMPILAKSSTRREPCLVDRVSIFEREFR